MFLLEKKIAQLAHVAGSNGRLGLANVQLVEGEPGYQAAATDGKVCVFVTSLAQRPPTDTDLEAVEVMNQTNILVPVEALAEQLKRLNKACPTAQAVMAGKYLVLKVLGERVDIPRFEGHFPDLTATLRLNAWPLRFPVNISSLLKVLGAMQTFAGDQDIAELGFGFGKNELLLTVAGTEYRVEAVVAGVKTDV